MITLQDLIIENTVLRSRLELAEKWMRREISTSIIKIQKEKISRGTRTRINTIWEQDGLDMITERLLSQFSSILPQAPKYTLERLIDADIYWHTLQQYPHMDALPIVLAYQKILDAWIEQILIAPFRIRMYHTHRDVSVSRLDIDILSIITKNYTLSLGRFYQILQSVRHNEVLSPMVSALVMDWKEYCPALFDIINSDIFFISFTDLIEREVFTRKRHESKVNYSDAKSIRELMIGNATYESFLELIFSSR